MSAKYYSQRQLSPYRGMVHVVDVGHALAYTIDGEQWRARLRSREGRLWPVGGWLDETHRFGPTDSAALMHAVNAKPPLPFPQADRIELWLLEPARLQPLALLQTRNSTTATSTPLDAMCRAFGADDVDFETACLRVGAHGTPVSREALSRLVSDAAGPHVIAQWFARTPDGAGKGLHGLRVPQALRGRVLGKPAFPELLMSEAWPDPAAAALAREYHDWHAPGLLTHLDLSRSTRRRLERAACRRPEKLLEMFRLIPAFVDRAALEVALVQARLMKTCVALQV